MKTERAKIAVAFLEEVIAGNIHDAYVKYVGKGMRHHNPFYTGDASSLEKGMVENDKEFPVKTIDIKHVIEDGDLIAVHSHVRLKQDSQGFAAVHIARFEGNTIAEFWDIVQEIPEKMANRNGMF